ncbi:MAG: M14 family metallopeptidase [Candidatus Methanomethylicia archaeon]
MGVLSPREFFGFEIGEDRKLARWDKIVEYFYHLAENSDRIKVVELGKSTEGNPFILAYISSPENLRDLEKYRWISHRLADPRGLSEIEVKRLVKEGKVVFVITNSLHATEVGGTQMSIELAYKLVTGDDETIKTILDNVILLLFPSINPDGQIMVVDWYYKYLGTEYEGTSLPWLYQKYVGHDNNRDAWMLTQVESNLLADVIYRYWKPQVFIDNHQMGSYSARFYIPPYYDPICPEIDPLVYREHQWFGGFMAVKLEEAGIQGVEGGPPYTAEMLAGFLDMAGLMNVCAMLTESASVKIATPIYIHKHQLTGHRGRVGDKKQYSFPNPWPGGWWRLKDIVKQILVSNLAALELAAKMKDTILYNMYLKAKRNIERGLSEPPYAYVIPIDSQADPSAALKLVDLILKWGVEVFVCEGEAKADGRIYPNGTYFVFSAQPYRGMLKYLLEKTIYPDNEWTRARDGTPIRPYDTATFTVPDFLGVKVDLINTRPEGVFKRVEGSIYPMYNVDNSEFGYLLSARYNPAYGVVNGLLDRGFTIYRIDESVEVDGETYPIGSFYIPNANGVRELLQSLSNKYHVPIKALKNKLEVGLREVKRLRVGIYQRYYGGSMDEGWTRWILEQYGFPYKIIKDEHVRNGKLPEEIDLLIFADDPPALILGESKEAIEKALSELYRRPVVLPPIPPEYMSGIKKEGLDKVKEFVNNGGTLLTFNSSCELAIETFKLPINIPSKKLDPKEFFCPSTILKVDVDNTHPICYGMPKRAYVMYHNSMILELVPTFNNEDYQTPITYPETDIMQSGWLIGEKYLSRKPALIDARQGKGRIILYAFKPQFRGQTLGTFKTIFNAIIQ